MKTTNKISVIALLVLITTPFYVNAEVSLSDLDTDAELIGWYVACKSVSYNNEEMTDIGIFFDGKFNEKVSQISSYPVNHQKYIKSSAMTTSGELIKKRFIVASCKDLYKNLSTIQNMK
ncbi:hypothetical protein [Agaribacterium sp. ZY112]|uniref:hypothetical protein n=1 Tax=Agaribacterium sp. ZY112 TaxID=3233574 RepID=UPI00352675BC